ncbi:universal stress protein [Neptunicella sp. SCSIO 80796]|uniref:universal stress protein n=1 Tax=Neptunicella plasticusilytica TaxID=3117012 RepID=UPI003A4E023A
MNRYQNVLVAIDPYSTYQPVLDRALSMVDNPAQLSLIHVTYPQRYFGPYGGDAYGAEMAQDWQTKNIEQINEIAQKNGLPLSQVYTPEGDAADEIHAHAKNKDCDLIVIGTHGQHGLKLLLGSTANAVLHGVKCDVLAVKI